jgi:hydroxymethylpyrimidine/phosphomethylpyrimidine kinase
MDVDNTPRAMTVAGSDSGGGAGIQADLKTFMNFNVYGATAITAITVQNTLGVSDVFMLPPAAVAAQIDAVAVDIGLDAAKTGMLGTREIIEAVAERIKYHDLARLVVDPVMVSTSGHRLLQEDAIKSYRDKMLPLSLVITPNLYEGEILSGMKINTLEELREAARRILDLGAQWVLLKGGHRQFDGGGAVVTDLLFDGRIFEEISNPRIDTTSTHGTGCTLSAAITAGLALGLSVPDAVRRAAAFTNGAIKTAVPVGGGHGPVNHRYKIGDISS